MKVILFKDAEEFVKFMEKTFGDKEPQDKIQCNVCNGIGQVNRHTENSAWSVPCTKCNGKGLIENKSVMPNLVTAIKCDECNGRGQIFKQGIDGFIHVRFCGKCNGAGWVNEESSEPKPTKCDETCRCPDCTKEREANQKSSTTTTTETYQGIWQPIHTAPYGILIFIKDKDGNISIGERKSISSFDVEYKTCGPEFKSWMPIKWPEE